MAEVTRPELHTAIAQLGPVKVRISGSDTTTDAVILYPHHVTARIIEHINAAPSPIPASHYCDSGNCEACGDGTGDEPDPAREPADNEIAALTVIVDRLEHLQTPTVQRVIRYLCDRYGTDG
jgi:hypothetical protein